MIRTEDELKRYYLELEVDPSAEQRVRGALAVTRVRRHRGRRLVIAAMAMIAALVVGAAAADGVRIVPQSLIDAFGLGHPDPGAYNAEPDTARLLFTIKNGPHGVPLQFWYTDATHNGYCTFVLAAPPDSSGPSSPGLGQSDAGECGGPVGGRWWHMFGANGGGASTDQGWIFMIHVPGAARVRLQFDDGSGRELPIAADWTAGWYRDTQAGLHPVVVGYNRDGDEIGRVRVRP